MTQVLAQSSHVSLAQSAQTETPSSAGNLPGRAEEDFLDWVENHARAETRSAPGNARVLIGIACVISVGAAILLAVVGHVR